jgi:hypothetical protein
MVVALAIVSGLGILARLRDRASERRAGEPIAVETPVAAQVDHLPGDTAAAG